MAVRTVRLAIVGGWHKVPMGDKDGNFVFKRDPKTGEILRDAQGRPEPELVDEYKEPDDARAAWFLERRAREDFGGGDHGVMVNLNPTPPRPEPKKGQLLDLLSQAVQILVDNGMKVPEPMMLGHRGTRAIETTATPAAESEAPTPRGKTCESANGPGRDRDVGQKIVGS